MPHTVSGFDYTCTVLRCIHCWFLQNSASHPVTQACRHHWPCVSQEVWQGWHNIQGQHNTGWQSQAVFSLHCQITPLACYGHIRAALFHLLSPHLCQSVRRLHYVIEKVGNSFLTLRSVFNLKLQSAIQHTCWSAGASSATWSTCPCPGILVLLTTSPLARNSIFWMSSLLNQGRRCKSALILLRSLSGKSCSVKLWHQSMSSSITATSGLDKAFLLASDPGIFFASEGSSERLRCFMKYPAGFLTACTLSDFRLCFVGCLCFFKPRCCCAIFALVWLPCICLSAFLFVCLNQNLAACLSAAPVSLSMGSAEALFSR